jgi:hypothetical protein
MAVSEVDVEDSLLTRRLTMTMRSLSRTLSSVSHAAAASRAQAAEGEVEREEGVKAAAAMIVMVRRGEGVGEWWLLCESRLSRGRAVSGWARIHLHTTTEARPSWYRGPYRHGSLKPHHKANATTPPTGP